MKQKRLTRAVVIGVILGLTGLGLAAFGWFNYPDRESLPTANLAPTISVQPSVVPTFDENYEDNQQKVNPTQTPKPTAQENILTKSISYEVPFTSQAPLGNWDDPLQQDGCEEASALMAVRWAQGKTIPSPTIARDMVVAAGQWQQENFPTGIDTSAQDTADRIIRQYFEWPHVTVQSLSEPEQIVAALLAGNLVITPMNGQKLGNPNFTGDGPPRHMLVVIGFDAQTQEFITNDPGTRNGQGYRYDLNVFWQAIRDYPTGDHVPITTENKVMIKIARPA